MMGDDFALVSFYTSLQKRRRVTSVFRKHCSFYERKENTHEYCTRPWCLGRRLLLERRHRAPAGRRLHRHPTPVSDDPPFRHRPPTPPATDPPDPPRHLR